MDSHKNFVALRRKLKFAPKVPPLRKPKPEVKTAVVDNDDSVQARDLLHRFNENSMKARPKVELHKLLLVTGVNQLPSNHMVFPRVEAVSTKVRFRDRVQRTSGLLQLLSYNSSYEEEFGEAVESRSNDENSSNPTMKLGLLEENPEKSMFLIQLPTTLPIIKGSPENFLIDGIRFGVLYDVVTYNTLIDAYCRFVSFDVGYAVLYRMNEASINPDIISYNSLISSTARNACCLSL
ncbi:putative DNA-directed RNA polymerase III subunit RPC4 [Lupinus albus]|uniref:Putative DNA-directed RNA polymerase III subunit RPC4 n=1 Tax=Lupinus albus TaxID=3870 RepID=A0A6A4R3J6_LUPAL|nr:putative DNA-directed RNA polymerase III subunit RPC4 [Lupinus albus]